LLNLIFTTKSFYNQRCLIHHSFSKSMLQQNLFSGPSVQTRTKTN